MVATVVRGRFRGLSACFGAPGPHDFAVRVSLARLATLPASTASRPAFVTTRTPLLPGRDGANTTTDLGFWKSEIFLQKGLDSEFEKRPVEAGQEFAHLLADLAAPETNIHYGVTYLAQAWRLAGGPSAAADGCVSVMASGPL